MVRAEDLRRLRGVFSGHALVSIVLEHAAQKTPNGLLVVDDEYARLITCLTVAKLRRDNPLSVE
jgi:hypothetical protein